jgi:hypothetical protein
LFALPRHHKDRHFKDSVSNLSNSRLRTLFVLNNEKDMIFLNYTFLKKSIKKVDSSLKLNHAGIGNAYKLFAYPEKIVYSKCLKVTRVYLFKGKYFGFKKQNKIR